MKKKKFLALLAAGVMTLSMSLTALAATPQEIATQYSAEDLYNGIWLTQDEWDAFNAYLEEKGIAWWDEEIGKMRLDEDAYNALVADLIASGEIVIDSGASTSGKAYDRVAEAEALAIKGMGYRNKTYVNALEEGKTVAEYMNNAVVETWGIKDAVPVAQGGKVVINGEKTNIEFSVLTVTSGQTAYAKSLAKSVNGTLLNVARIDSPVYFDTATVNFYMPGVKAGQNIQVYRYDRAKAQWVNVDVTEVREDHVVVNMTADGIMAFINVAAN